MRPGGLRGACWGGGATTHEDERAGLWSGAAAHPSVGDARVPLGHASQLRWHWVVASMGRRRRDAGTESRDGRGCGGGGNLVARGGFEWRQRPTGKVRCWEQE
jgi:hypothetical protein